MEDVMGLMTVAQATEAMRAIDRLPELADEADERQSRKCEIIYDLLCDMGYPECAVAFWPSRRAD
jgi:hypothetical protein